MRILDKKKFSGKLILFLIVLPVGVLLRLHCLTIRPVWYDETITIFYAKSSFEFISKQFIHGSNPPFAYYFYHVWNLIFKDSQLSFELVSVIFGVLSILAIYRIGVQLFSKSAALIAAALLAFSSYHIFISQQIRGYSIACFFTLMSLSYFISLKESGKIQDFLKWLTFSLLMLCTHFYTIFLFVVQCGAFCILQKNDKNNRLKLNSWISKFLFWLALIVIPLAFFLQQRYPQAFPIYPRSHVSIGDVLLIFQSVGFLSPVLAISSLVFVLLSIKKKWDFIFLTSWVAISILVPYCLSRDGSSFFYVRYYIFSHLAWILLTAFAIDRLFRGIWKILIPAFFIFAITFLLSDYYAECKEKARVRNAYETVRGGFQEGDVILHENGWTFGPSYYYHRGHYPEFFLTEEFGIPNHWDKKIDSSQLSSYKRIWLFVESSDRFQMLSNQEWFQRLRPKLIKEDPLHHAWYLFQVSQI